MRIVVLGNCQAGCVGDAIRRACAADASVTVHVVAAYKSASEADRAALRAADVLVEQLTDTQQRTAVPDGQGPARRIAFPLLEASFLYPFSTVAHPRSHELDRDPALHGLYNPQLSDSRLIALMKLHPRDTPAKLTERYLALDYAAEIDLDALLERSHQKAMRLGEKAGLEVWSRTERLFRYQPVFWTVLHPGEVLLRPIYRHVLEGLKLGLTEAEIEAAGIGSGSGLAYSHAPIHPSVARHFGIEWVSGRTRYHTRHEGQWTIADYADRFVRFSYDEGLARAHHDLHTGTDPLGALKALLEARTRQPKNAHLMISIASAFAALGDVPSALEATTTALSLDPEQPEWVRLHVALTRMLIQPVTLAAPVPVRPVLADAA